MTTIAELFNRAVQQHQAGQLAEAEQLYQEILLQQPNHAGALNLIGVITCQQGNLSEGIRYYQQALAADSQMAGAYHNLALALQMTGRTEEAIAQYRTAIALQPNNAEAHYNLGSLVLQRGNIPAGLGHYRQALAIRPQYVEVYISLGAFLLSQGQLDEATAHLQQALQLQPNSFQAYFYLGQTKLVAGQVDEAVPLLQQALQFQAHPALYYSLGKAFEEQGRTAAAITQFERALILQPNYPEALWHKHLVVPPLYDTPDDITAARQRFSDGLTALIQATDLTTPEGRQSALQGLGSRTNFYLAYQGLNDRDLQQRYGAFVQQIMAANYPQWASIELPKRSDSRIRIGYLSAHFMAHSAAAWARGWLQHRDRTQFEVYCYHIGQRLDYVTKEFHDLSDQFRHLPATVDAIAAQIRADQLDVLVFTDLGMEARSTQLAGLRLAPIQCTAWGHPVTSGLPTVDYYLSGELMEPEQAQEHYTETLIRLPHLGICVSKPPFPGIQRTRANMGLRDDAVLYLSFQAPFKYLPQRDRIIAEIARQVPNSQFLFLQANSGYATERFQHRMRHAFAAVGLSSDAHCVWWPKLDRESYLSLTWAADVFLSPLDWSGGTSTLDAVAYGIPVVTYPGEFARGRHSAAILTQLGATETIAASPDDYGAIAVRLGQDPDWRRAVSQHIAAGQARLFDNTDCVRGLETFFQDAVQRLRVG